MKKLVFLMALAAVVLLGYTSANATHQGASTPCCACAPSGNACNEQAPPSVALRGCAEDDVTGSCAGGNALVGSGCVCVGGTCISGSPQGGAQQGGAACTANSVSNCGPQTHSCTP